MRSLLLAVLVGMGLSVTPLARAADKPAEKPRTIEIALCLDASGSMDGLINSAKSKLWDIVNDLGRIKPTPNLKVTLYSYGTDLETYDAKAGWVRKECDLTTDLDLVYQKLSAVSAGGVMECREYVARVSRDAIEQQKWSEDKDALKIIFVCGNEPVDQDKDVRLEDVAKKAKEKGIIINTIYCQWDPTRFGPPYGPGYKVEAEIDGWKQFAKLAGGRFASIDQEKGVLAIATPFDKDLAELSTQLNGTFCFWGKDAKDLARNQAEQDKNSVDQGYANAAARAQSKASGLYCFEHADLVEQLKKDPKFDVNKMPEKELPEVMQKMKPEERTKHIKDLLTKREEISKKVADLGKQREEFIAKELKKQTKKGGGAFDDAIRGALRDQAASKGIQIPD